MSNGQVTELSIAQREHDIDEGQRLLFEALPISEQQQITREREAFQRICGAFNREYSTSQNPGITDLPKSVETRVVGQCYWAKTRKWGEVYKVYITPHKRMRAACKYDGCTRVPIFGCAKVHPRRVLYCAAHIEPALGWQNISRKSCDQCSKSAIYGYDGEDATSCNEHADVNMINVRSSKKCAEVCRRRANYGNPNDRIATHCSNHAHEYMKIVKKSKWCNFVENDVKCRRSPRWGEDGDCVATMCTPHRPQNAVYLV